MEGSNTELWKMCLIVPTAIIAETIFDEYIMRRRPIIGFIIAMLTILAITVVASSTAVQTMMGVQHTLTLFVVIKAYLLCLPATLLSIFRCIHGSENQFNTFKKYLFCSAQWLNYKMGNPRILAIICYLFLVFNMTEAIIFELLMCFNYDLRDNEEQDYNPFTTGSQWSCLYNAVAGILVIIMIPLPSNNWYLFSEYKEENTDAVCDIGGSSNIATKNAEQQIIVDAVNNDVELSSIKYDDIAMYLPTKGTIALIASYFWIFCYTSWNFLFTVRNFGGSQLSMAPVHLLPCIIRALYHWRSDLWVQSRLHVLWSCLFFYVPITKALGITTKHTKLNQYYMIIWSVLNLVASVACLILFIIIKRNGAQPSPFKQHKNNNNQNNQKTSTHVTNEVKEQMEA